MSPIIVSTFGAFTALLLVFAISEILAKVTKGWVPSVLVIMILMLVGFSTGLFPKTIIDTPACLMRCSKSPAVCSSPISARL